MELAVAGDLDAGPLGKGVDARGPNAMEPAGDFITATAELGTGVESAKDDFQRGLAGELRVRPDGYAAAVVGDGEGAVGVERDVYVLADAGEVFVDRVVEDFPGELVKAASVAAGDVHVGSVSNRLETLEDRDTGLIVDLGRAARRAGHVRSFLSGGFEKKLRFLGRCFWTKNGRSRDGRIVTKTAVFSRFFAFCTHLTK
jgi:hypothetical protein